MDTRALLTLVRKDLLTVWRKPLGYIVNLAIPLFMVGTVGLIFGSGGDGGAALGRMKIAVVDEDSSFFSELLRGAMARGEAAERLELRFLDRDAAMEAVLDNEISAALIIPKGFSEGYVSGAGAPPLELVKNPAHYFHPAVIEELIGALAEGGNGLHRVLGDDLPEWRKLFEQEGVPDIAWAVRLAQKLEPKLDRAGEILFPPLVQYRAETRADSNDDDKRPAFDLFAFLLPGFVGMFLFFIADNAIRDIYREEQRKTLERYRVHRTSIAPFLISKVLVAFLVTLACIVSLVAVGALVFGIDWTHPLKILLFTAAYSVFVTGFIALLNAVAGSEKRAEAINPTVIFAIAAFGGNMVPADQLPTVLTENVSSLLPNYWYIRGMHHLQFDWGAPVALYAGLMVGIGIAFVLLGARVLRRRLEKRAF